MTRKWRQNAIEKPQNTTSSPYNRLTSLSIYIIRHRTTWSVKLWHKNLHDTERRTQQ